MGWVWGGVRRDRWDWVKAPLHSTAALLTYWLATTYCLPASLVSGGSGAAPAAGVGWRFSTMMVFASGKPARHIWVESSSVHAFAASASAKTSAVLLASKAPAVSAGSSKD